MEDSSLATGLSDGETLTGSCQGDYRPTEVLEAKPCIWWQPGSVLEKVPRFWALTQCCRTPRAS